MKTSWKVTRNQRLFCFLFVWFASCASAFAQPIRGMVSDEDGNALVGANVVVKDAFFGTTTDSEGAFSLDYDGNYPITLAVSYIGYVTEEIEIQQAVSDLQIRLAGDVIVGQELVVSASRRPEKLQEAPAAVSVLSAEELSAPGAAITPVRALINTPGVELQQQTGQRINLALRGSSSIFATDVFPMLDYRSLISPGLEFFDSQNSPINQIDLERVEVVLGPGSALYGPDVTSGVVHFISKDPFTYPGTTVELVGGNQSTYQAAIRHAGHSADNKFGYKINARYGAGDDFTLQPGNPEDAAILANFQDVVRRGFVTGQGFIDPQQEGAALLTTDKTQRQDYWSSAVNGQLHFKPGAQTEIIGSGGWNAGSAIFYNELGEGFNHSNEYWGQLRFSQGGLFAQAYYILNDGGTDSNPIYLNRTGLIVPLERNHLEAQVQYNFSTPSLLNAEWTTGVDFRNAGSNTQHHVYGRNEGDDDYRILGGYLQSKLKFGDQLDLFLAGRLDTYNFTDEKTISPRAALVYKPNPVHSLRLSYNRAANPIPASDIYFDLPLQTTPVFNVWNLGGIRPQTFENPMITWLIPGVPETPFEVGFPLAAAYSFVNEGVIEQIKERVPEPIQTLLVGLLLADSPDGFSNGISSTDLDGNELLPVTRETKLISQLSALEAGYKGLFWERFAAGFDVYYFRKTGAGGFSQVSPVITMTSLPADLGAGVQSTFQPQVEAGLLELGYDPDTAAALAGELGALLNDAYRQGGVFFLSELIEAGLPFHGIVESDQVPDTGLPNLAFGYPTFDPDAVSDDWGFEVHARYYFSDELTLFGNYTWFNRPTGRPGDLNFPQNKIRAGLNYAPEAGLRGSVAYQWDQAYTSNNATFPGKIDARSLVDLSIGYGLKNGISVETSATNLFDNEFRSLPGFPRIGRRIHARVTYDF